jgi:hypothetical protein
MRADVGKKPRLWLGLTFLESEFSLMQFDIKPLLLAGTVPAFEDRYEVGRKKVS